METFRFFLKKKYPFEVPKKINKNSTKDLKGAKMIQSSFFVIFLSFAKLQLNLFDCVRLLKFFDSTKVFAIWFFQA